MYSSESHWARTKLGLSAGRINLVKRVQKQNYAKVAGQPAILIDDYPKNTTQFTQEVVLVYIIHQHQTLSKNLKN